MKQLIHHLVSNNLAEIAAKSFMNCHCKGVHSIMLLDSPGQTIRLYIAEKGNELRKNFPLNIKGHTEENGTLSIGFHSHHCDLTLHCIKGELLNWIIEKGSHRDPIVLNEYLYQSQIKEGAMKFQLQKENVSFHTDEMQWVSKGGIAMMKAYQIHTVACNPNHITAWFVYEGKEDLLYQSLCYTNADPNLQDCSSLYQPMSRKQVLRLLLDCDLIL